MRDDDRDNILNYIRPSTRRRLASDTLVARIAAAIWFAWLLFLLISFYGPFWK